MVKEEQFQLKFDDFFPKIEELQSNIKITIFCVISGSYVHVYMQPSGRFVTTVVILILFVVLLE